jgi:hypothetical protein
MYGTEIGKNQAKICGQILSIQEILARMDRSTGQLPE